MTGLQLAVSQPPARQATARRHVQRERLRQAWRTVLPVAPVRGKAALLLPEPRRDCQLFHRRFRFVEWREWNLTREQPAIWPPVAPVRP